MYFCIGYKVLVQKANKAKQNIGVLIKGTAENKYKLKFIWRKEYFWYTPKRKLGLPDAYFSEEV